MLPGVVAGTLQGSSGQRCRIHLLRDTLTHVPGGQTEMVTAPPEPSLPEAAVALADAENDVKSYAVFPGNDRQEIRLLSDAFCHERDDATRVLLRYSHRQLTDEPGDSLEPRVRESMDCVLVGRDEEVLVGGVEKNGTADSG